MFTPFSAVVIEKLLKIDMWLRFKLFQLSNTMFSDNVSIKHFIRNKYAYNSLDCVVYFVRYQDIFHR